jgi:hypothetical protein
MHLALFGLPVNNPAKADLRLDWEREAADEL